MGIYGYIWVYMEVNMGIYGYIWVYMGIYGSIWIYVGTYGYIGYIWVHKTYAWVYMGIYRHDRALKIDFWLRLRPK